MKRRYSLLAKFLFAVILFSLSTLAACHQSGTDRLDSDSAGSALWTCPMHPDYVSDKPGECPICHMTLVPKRSAGAEQHQHAGHGMNGASGDRAALQLDREQQLRAGIATDTVREENLPETIRTVGVVTLDQTRLHHLHVRTAGWIEKLYANFEGKAVSAGERLFDLYSPELVATQNEFLRARQTDKRLGESPLPELRSLDSSLAAAAKARLETMGMPADSIAALEASGETQRSVTFKAPHAGFIVARELFEGMRVEPADDLLTIGDLEHLWIEADLFEAEAGRVAVGRSATIAVPAEPGLSLTGKVVYIFPQLQPETRTLKVRFDFENRRQRLKPGMFAEVLLELEPHRGLTIPDSAIVDTGVRQLVYVARDEARFEPREVKVGLRQSGRALILDGLQAGEQVVSSGAFLLDSESRLEAPRSGPAR